MQDVRIDQDGRMRCRTCGARSFKRSEFLQRMAPRVATLAAPTQRCRVCGERNDTAHAQPYAVPLRPH